MLSWKDTELDGGVQETSDTPGCRPASSPPDESTSSDCLMNHLQKIRAVELQQKSSHLQFKNDFCLSEGVPGFKPSEVSG